MRHHHLLVVDAAVPVIVAGAVGVGDVVHSGAGSDPAAILLGIGAALTLFGRRRWPGWTLAVSGVVVVVLFHLDKSAATVAVLAPAVALYSLALRRGRRSQIAAAILAIAAVVAADLAHSGRPTVGETVGHVLLVAIPLLAAEVIRTHQANVKLLVERLALADRAREQEAERRAEQERIRIARDLHDVLAHTLTEINVTAAAAAERADPADRQNALERIETTSHTALNELRGILGVLRDQDNDGPRDPCPGVDDINALVDDVRRNGTQVVLDATGTQPAYLSEATGLAAYRIVQEALTNARRHAPGAQVTVSLRYDADQLTITVDNDIEPTIVGADSHGVGLLGMRERAEVIGGRLRAQTVGATFRVSAELPYEPSR